MIKVLKIERLLESVNALYWLISQRIFIPSRHYKNPTFELGNEGYEQSYQALINIRTLAYFLMNH